MRIDRRGLFKLTLAAGGGTLLSRPSRAGAATGSHLNADRWGMLVDTTLCVGCRHCEWACKQQNKLPSAPLSQFSDTSVFEKMRRPDDTSYTVVNRFNNPDDPDNPVYAKVQCMHCDHAACVSACLVGALQKDKHGPVVYNGGKCMGCRYCMVACPFQIPAYEYFNALTPVVRKCTFCFDRVSQQGDFPACCKICPQEVMTFGRRSDLLKAARERINNHPDRYISKIYGEHEVGGTGWLYLSGVPFEKLGFLPLGDKPVSQLNETIQHSIFKYFIPPLALYGLLGGLMWTFKNKEE
jgi:formate dehydrogenase iron-sulfur subunit